ncbi:hypothetical protein Pfo_027171 [Paulownia fortunei]|nr:hypothetical protein Pfo_027171 [Paulownia fortunei]
MVVEQHGLIQPPRPLRESSRRVKSDKYCRFHRDRGHTTKEYFHLKQEIERLIHKGYLTEFVEKVNSNRRDQRRHNAPRHGDSSNARRVLLRAASGVNSHNPSSYPSEQVYQLQTSIEQLTFGESDLEGRQEQHNDALILVDSGSSADIIFYDAFLKIDIDNAQLSPVNTPLTGFRGEMVEALGEVVIPFSLGSYPRRITKMVKFLVVNAPSTYNMILGRPSLNIFHAVASTYHMKLKFPTHKGIVNSVDGELQEKNKKPDDMKLKAIEELKIIRTGLAPEVDEHLSTFLRHNVDVFAWSIEELVGIPLKLALHQLNKKRTFGPKRSQHIKEEVNKLLAANYIRPVRYPEWLANVVLVPKSGGKWRLCIDFTDLNKTCPKDPFLLPRIDRLVDSTSGCEMLSFLDAYQGYNQIRLAPEDEEMTNFVTDQGIYCYRVMPFVLKNARATYQCLVNNIFAELIGRNMEVYIDDMLVKSKLASNHMSDLEECFNILRTYQMKLNPTKYTFGVRGGKFWGYMISQRGIEANPEKIDAILNMPPPRHIKHLALALITATRKLCPYFQSHPVVVLTNHPLKQVLSNPETSRRLVKWVIELSEHGIEFRPRPAIKAQVLADFVVEITTDEISNSLSAWTLYIDGSSTSTGSRAGIFLTSNNEVEYEALLAGLKLAFTAEARKLAIYSDSRLVVNQVRGEYEVRDEKMIKYLSLTHYIADNMIANQLAKLASSMANINTQKITFLSSKPSWKDNIVQYLTTGELPDNPVDAGKLKIRAARFLIVDGELYKRGFSQPYLKCLTPTKANYVFREIHEGICGNHLGGKSLNIICRFGIPRALISDNGTQFIGAKIQKWCQGLSIKQFFTSVGNPQANGQTEVTNRIILQHLKTCLGSAKGGWVDELPSILWAYRTTPRVATGEFPFNLTYGIEAIAPGEIGEPSWWMMNYAIKEKVASYSEIYKARMARAYNMKVHSRSFQVEDLVLRKAEVLRPIKKLYPKWEGPYKVVEIVNAATYDHKEWMEEMYPAHGTSSTLRNSTPKCASNFNNAYLHS